MNKNSKNSQGTYRKFRRDEGGGQRTNTEWSNTSQIARIGLTRRNIDPMKGSTQERQVRSQHKDLSDPARKTHLHLQKLLLHVKLQTGVQDQCWKVQTIAQ